MEIYLLIKLLKSTRDNIGQVLLTSGLCQVFHIEQYMVSTQTSTPPYPPLLNNFFFCSFSLPFVCMQMLSQTLESCLLFFLSLAWCYFHVLISGLGLKLDPLTQMPHCWAFLPLLLFSPSVSSAKLIFGLCVPHT